MAVRQAQFRGLALREALGRRRVLRLEALLDFSDGGYGDPGSQIERIHAYAHSDSDLQFERVLGYYSEVGYYSDSDLQLERVLGYYSEVGQEQVGQTVERDDERPKIIPQTQVLPMVSVGPKFVDEPQAAIADPVVEDPAQHMNNSEGVFIVIGRDGEINQAILEEDMKVTMNVDNLESAFDFEQMPGDGTGLVRLEHIVNNAVGIHPRALIDYGTLDVEVKALVDTKIQDYASPRDFYVRQIVGGVAALAVSVFPKHFIVRVSDFKNHEYKSLIGGDWYELDDENFLTDFRDCGHFTDPFFRECFDMEIEAIKKVRDDLGLTNVGVLVPFVRTLALAGEARTVLERHFGGWHARVPMAAEVQKPVEVPQIECDALQTHVPGHDSDRDSDGYDSMLDLEPARYGGNSEYSSDYDDDGYGCADTGGDGSSVTDSDDDESAGDEKERGGAVGSDEREEPTPHFRTWAEWRKLNVAGRTREEVRADAENAWLQRLDAAGRRPASCAGLSWGKGRGG